MNTRHKNLTLLKSHAGVFLKRYICIPADNTCHKWDFHWRAVREEKNTLLCTKFKLETEHFKTANTSSVSPIIHD